MLALFAGRGGLPARVVSGMASPPLICALESTPPEGVVPDVTFRLETLGSFLVELATRGVTEICFCGAIDRPDIDPALLDEDTKPLVPILMDALNKGDDGALRAVIDLFERTGFSVRGAHELAPSILMESGIKTTRQMRDVHREDVLAALKVVDEMGAQDLGQTCVVRKGVVLAREDATGTDAMLARLAIPQDSAGDAPLENLLENARRMAPVLHNAPGAGGVMYKAPKPQQDRRVDLPTIGPDTAIAAASAGLDGIVIQAGEVIVLDAERVIDILNEFNLFLWVRP